MLHTWSHLAGRGGSVSRRDHNQAAIGPAPTLRRNQLEESAPAKRQPLFGRGVWGEGASLREAACGAWGGRGGAGEGPPPPPPPPIALFLGGGRGGLVKKPPPGPPWKGGVGGRGGFGGGGGGGGGG